MADKSGVQLIGAAVVALGFIVGGAIVASALNGVSGEIEQTRASLKEIKAEITTVPRRGGRARTRTSGTRLT
jgi:uncharacterized protein YoxC